MARRNIPSSVSSENSEQTMAQIARELSDTLLRLIREIVTATRAAEERIYWPEIVRDPQPPKILFKLEEAAKILSIPVAVLKRFIDQSEIHTTTKGTRVRIHRDEIERWAKKRPVEDVDPKRRG